MDAYMRGRRAVEERLQWQFARQMAQERLRLAQRQQTLLEQQFAALRQERAANEAVTMARAMLRTRDPRPDVGLPMVSMPPLPPLPAEPGSPDAPTQASPGSALAQLEAASRVAKGLSPDVEVRSGAVSPEADASVRREPAKPAAPATRASGTKGVQKGRKARSR